MLISSNSFLSLSGLPVPFAPSLDSFKDPKPGPASESLVFALLDEINVERGVNILKKSYEA